MAENGIENIDKEIEAFLNGLNEFKSPSSKSYDALT